MYFLSFITSLICNRLKVVWLSASYSEPGVGLDYCEEELQGGKTIELKLLSLKCSIFLNIHVQNPYEAFAKEKLLSIIFFSCLFRM